MDHRSGLEGDVIGVVLEATPMQQITSKKQQLLYKRDVTLMDRSGAAVKLTIWGEKEIDPTQLVSHSCQRTQSGSECTSSC